MTEPRIPDIILERYRLSELPADEAARVADLVRREPRLRERLAALEQSDEEIRRSGVLGVRMPAREPRAWPRAYWLVPASMAVALTLVLAAVGPRSADRGDVRIADGGDNRIKGAQPALALYRRIPDGSESLADGAVARAGDVVRIGYRAAGQSYGVIFSIDGRGNVTMHLPPSGDRAAPLGRSATVLLDAAYELDDAPLWERFYFITGDAPFGVAPVVDAVRHAAALPRGLHQSTFALQKEVRP